MIIHEKAAAWAVASIDGLGPATFRRIIEINRQRGVDFRRFLTLPPQAWRDEYHLRPAQIEALLETCARAPSSELDRQLATGRSLVMIDDPSYPSRLRKALGERSPSYLWTLGDVHLAQRPSIAVVGTRRPSEWAAPSVQALVRRAGAEGRVVISGFAEGVDRLAHEAALDTGTATILVLPTGLDRWKAPPRYSFAIEAGQALVISQFNAEGRFSSGAAMARNRVVAALSELVIAVETGIRGGTMRTAGMALELERPLSTLVNPPKGRTPAGNARLLEQGARPLPLYCDGQGRRVRLPDDALSTSPRLYPGQQRMEL